MWRKKIRQKRLLCRNNNILGSGGQYDNRKGRNIWTCNEYFEI